MTEHYDTNAPPGDDGAEWLVHIRDGDLTAAERRRYLRWLKQSPHNIVVFLQLARLYKRLKIAQFPMPAPVAEQPSNVIDLVPRAEDSSPAAAGDAQRRRLSARVKIAAAVTCVALAGVIGVAVKLALFSNHTVDQFNRRNRIQIRVDDAEIAARPACCVFDAADPESFAESIAVAPDAALERESSNLLRSVPEVYQESATGSALQASNPL